LYCNRTFSSASLYANHINRPVAQVLYRCHLCSTQSDTAHTPTVIPVLQRPSFSSHTTVSPSGSGDPVLAMPSPCNLSAPNLCALYVHMAQWHANEPVAAWRLIPSHLTVNALPWFDSKAKAESVDGASRSAPIQPPLATSLPSTTYIDGQELIDLGNDLDRRLTNLLRAGEFTFLAGEVGGRAEEKTFLGVPDIRLMTSSLTQFPLTLTQPTDLSVDGLPRSLASPICHLLFRLAEASIWHGYFFLTGWYPSFKDVQDTGLSLPCAASVKQIEQAYNALLRDSQTDTGCRTGRGEGRGVLRCLLCGEFSTNSVAALRAHLNGNGSDSDVSPAKCALCALSVVHNRKDMVLCSIKAHLLLHLDIYLMCPQCGFTPPPDLTASLAEVCLRLHLRFVCFHFNLVKVLLCSRGSCKDRTFLTMESFVQHWFEMHTARKYACQLCGSLGQRRKMEDGIADGAFFLLYR
uniref:C2H2-type domain-containing protein n=1 Tax=Hydatigena taeniaeformis TaxID=6205 RepID=A0A0R3WRS9_HYDTA